MAGAFVTSVIMYPVDVVRAICMSNPGTGVMEAYGRASFTKGLVSEVTRASISRAVKFFFQPIAHQRVFGKKESDGNPITKGFAGALATIPEVVAISPLENVKLAMQLDKEGRFKGDADVIRHIARTRGFAGFYIGFSGMLVRQMLWTSGFFMTLDFYKGMTPFENKLAKDVSGGFLAGASGVVLNCWCDVCRSIVQKEALAATFDSTIPRPSTLSAFSPGPFIAATSKLLGERGMAGLYSGVLPKMVHLGGSGAILAVLMPRFKAAWFKMNGLTADENTHAQIRKHSSQAH